ncbi:universal stress protein [Microvirga sp. BT688]|uniref:universal stress protein n=1 Tax=Microvirga sp. TaxID=1873136 RepID=UPI001689EE6C|nr:universal stress protein [Microvirga sp.]MBD2750645.1 universal stress protein [Microvirga sp.]
MPFRNLLLVIGNNTEASERYALDLTRLNGAALTVTTSGAAPSLSAFFRSELPSDLLDHMREDVENTARAALDAFAERAKQEGVSVETVMPDLSLGDSSGEVSRLARYFDGTVLQQPDPAGTETADLIEAVLFRSGRPVVIVPSHQGPLQPRTVLIAWDEGRPAARAVADALPLLVIAERVEVVTVGTHGRDRERHSSHLVRHLARHGIETHGASLVTDRGSVASMLLCHAAEVKADLIVMGGYGHSRLREIVLGGTTRRIIQTMTVPVLMAH